ncbi:MAG: hypothetical protein OHK0022_22570 [Roseiflexaceae bacterium]
MGARDRFAAVNDSANQAWGQVLCNLSKLQSLRRHKAVYTPEGPHWLHRALCKLSKLCPARSRITAQNLDTADPLVYSAV